MSEQPTDLVLELLPALRSDVSELRAETNLKVGSLVQGMVSMRKDINELTDAVNTMRADTRMIALAVDEHTHRLDKIESHFAQTHA